jgi:phosphohistidine swiveling domain-containing protein
MIVDLSDARALDAALTGGKGSQLAALAAKGFPVPPGFVVTTEAFAAFLEAGDLQNEIEKISSSTLSEAGSLQARITAMGLPEPVSGALRERLLDFERRLDSDARWAVRSSAVAEDLAGASFAGQYDSVLGVTGFEEVAAALLRCWASFFNARALQYRRDRGIRDLRGAVVVQRLISADAAGVCFTLDPVSGGSDRVVVNSNFGLGESVVSGRATPDTFVIDKLSRRMIHRQVPTKALKVAPVPGGTAEVAIEESLRGSASLTDEQARAVAALAIRVEEQVGRPVDIEWAMRNGELFLLQSRPVTAAGPNAGTHTEACRASPPEDWVPELNTPIDPRYPLYSNGNISEVLPGCITPLSWSYIGPTIEHAFRTQGIALGGMEPARPEYQVLGFFFHRPYVCVSYLEAAAARVPGMSPDAIHEEFVAPPAVPTPAVTGRDLWPDRWPALARVGLTFLRKLLSVEREARACEKTIRRQGEECEAERLQRWSDERLLEAVRFSEPMARVSDTHVWASSFAVVFFGLLRKLTRAWLDDGDGSLAAQMVTGIGSLPSADPAFGLYHLARTVMSCAELERYFDSISDDRAVLEAIQTDESAGEFRSALQEFLRAFGHRAVCEAEFRNPCWREDPAQVVALVRNYLQPGLTPPEAVRTRQKRVRSDAQRRVESLPLVKRVVLRHVIERTRRGMELRERLKDLIVLRSDRARRIYAELRHRLVSRKQLADADDIYFLLGSEVADLLRGVTDAGTAEAIIGRRRRDFAWCEAVRLPKIQQGVAITVTAADFASATQLKGTGVSPGKVEGRARIIRDPRTNSHIEPGEILVAPVTDAGWTPLFINAAGLVVEVGGLLSHGSVVAREYGLPAVVGVTAATERIQTGDRLYLDGSSGIVVKLDEYDRGEVAGTAACR